MSDVAEVKEALHKWAWLNEHGTTRQAIEYVIDHEPSILPGVFDAARRLVEVAETSQEVEWCDEHDASVVAELGGCGKYEPADCRVVSRRLVDPQQLPGGE